LAFSLSQIRCLKSNHPACSGVPQTVIITDMNYYPVAKYHFDLSGTAFGAMASSGLNDKLRHAGIIDMQFRRVPCNFPGLTITFRVQHGSNPMYLAVLIEHENQDGDVVQADIMQNDSGYWEPMHESWGSGGSTPTARSGGPSPSASPTSPASSWWPRTLSRPTMSPTSITAPTSSILINRPRSICMQPSELIAAGRRLSVLV
jgi:hypothetical protein